VLRASLLLLRKDLRLRTRDRSVLLFAFVVPLGLTAVFSFIFPSEGELEIRGAVVDLDGGPVGAGLADELLPALVDQGVLLSVDRLDEDEARSQVTDGDLAVAWVVPAGTSQAITTGAGATIEVLVADGRVLSGEVARGVARAYAAEIDRIGLAVVTAASATGSPPDGELTQQIAATAATVAPVATVVDATTGSGQRMDITSYLAAGMAAFFVFFTVQFGVSGLLEERELGTLPRLLASPIPPAAVQAGKLLGAFLLGLVSMTVLAVASSLLLGASWGPTPGVALLVVALVLAALGVMSLVGSFAKTAEQAGNLQSIVAVVLGLLGGVFFPLPGDNLLLRTLTSVSPHGWFLRGLQDLVASGDWTVVLPNVVAITAFGLAASVPAMVLLRRRSTW
jgi:ABC-2 type transport system permease protein